MHGDLAAQWYPLPFFGGVMGYITYKVTNPKKGALDIAWFAGLPWRLCVVLGYGFPYKCN